MRRARQPQKPDDQPEGGRQRRSDGLDLTPRELSVIDFLREAVPNKLIATQQSAFPELPIGPAVTRISINVERR
jgi:hypothetical protein